MNQKIKIKKGDKVIVLVGRDKGKTGVVDRVSTKSGKLLVVGVNIVKKHVKVSTKFPQGGVAEVVKPLNVSKIQLICPNCGKSTRIGLETKGKEKTRFCKKCKKTIVSKVGTDSKEAVEPKKQDNKSKAK